MTDFPELVSCRFNSAYKVKEAQSRLFIKNMWKISTCELTADGKSSIPETHSSYILAYRLEQSHLAN